MTERLSTTIPSMNGFQATQAEFDKARAEVTRLEKAWNDPEIDGPDSGAIAAAEAVVAETKEELGGELKGFYQELAGFDPDPVKMLETGKMLAEAFGPNSISMDPGVKEQIIEAVCAGRPIVFCPNHVRAEDQYILIAALLAQQEKEFAAIIEHIRIMFKVEYAEGKDNKAIGFGPEQLIPLGGLPVVRPTRDDEVAKMAIEPFNDMIDELSERENYFVGFYESTRNQGADPHTVQKVRQGAGHFAVRATQLDLPISKHRKDPIPESNALFIPIGISYTPYVDPRFAPANIHFGAPVTFKPRKKKDGMENEKLPEDEKGFVELFTINLEEAMQDAVDKSLPVGQMALFNIPDKMRV